MPHLTQSPVVACNAILKLSEKMDLQLIFDLDTTLQLTNEQFQMLVNTGETLTDFAPAKDYYIEEDFSRLFLSYDSSLSDFFFEFDTENDINTFLQNAYLTNFYPKTGKIKLIPDFDITLDKLLLNKRHQIDNILQFEKEKFPTEQKIFTDVLNQNSLDTLFKTGDFKGLIACCECGEQGCSSQYIWATDFIGLISFHIFAAEFVRVCLYPFKLI